MWNGLWNEVFGTTLGKPLKLMVGLGGLEPPTSPLSGARSSHLSYRPLQNRVATAHNLFSLRCLSMIRNCVQIRALCTSRQFLDHFSLLSVFQVLVSCW